MNENKSCVAFDGMTLHPVAFFHSPFPSKFGIPKQSGLVGGLEGFIEFVPEYRNPDFLRGIDGFDYLWLVWQFSANPHRATSPLVRPPLLGGNEKVGVFASRSPFRPNPIGLSCVKLDRVDYEAHNAPLVFVRGADLMDGTPVFDIKPYVALADCHSDARCGFVDSNEIRRLRVDVPDSLAELFSAGDLDVLKKILELDPRPHYHSDGVKVYGMPFGKYDVKFRVEGDTLTVVGLT